MPEPQWTRLTRTELDALDGAHNTLVIECAALRIKMAPSQRLECRMALARIYKALDEINDLVRNHKRTASLGLGTIADRRSDDQAAAQYESRVRAEIADAEEEEMGAQLLMENLPI